MRIWMAEVMKKPTAYSRQLTAKRRERPYHRGHRGAQSSRRRRGESFCWDLGKFALLGLVPEGFELGPGNFGESGSLVAGDAFHFAEAAGEFGAGIVQGDFGVDVEEAGEIYGDEKDVAEFGFDAGGGLFFAEDFAEFGGFFAELVEDAFYVVPVETDAGGFAGELEGA